MHNIVAHHALTISQQMSEQDLSFPTSYSLPYKAVKTLIITFHGVGMCL